MKVTELLSLIKDEDLSVGLYKKSDVDWIKQNGAHSRYTLFKRDKTWFAEQFKFNAEFEEEDYYFEDVPLNTIQASYTDKEVIELSIVPGTEDVILLIVAE